MKRMMLEELTCFLKHNGLEIVSPFENERSSLALYTYTAKDVKVKDKDGNVHTITVRIPDFDMSMMLVERGFI